MYDIVEKSWPMSVGDETDLPIHVDEEPLTCVVRGAGRILDEFERFRNVLQN
jgi:rod shape-determining protein MreB